jgi:hypothetical protein
LPALYSKRLNDYTMQIEQFIGEAQAAAAEAAAEQAQWEAEFTEKSRHNRVSEAISATNSQTNAAIQLGRLGLDASDQAFDNQPGSQPTNLPVGFVAVPDGKGGWKVQQDPTYSKPGGTGKPSTRGTYPANQLRKEGFVKLPKGAGAKWRNRATRATDGSLWIKKGSAGGGTTKPGEVRSAFNLREDLTQKWRPSSGDGIEYRFDGDPDGAGKWLAAWIRENKKHFIRGPGRKADLKKIKDVIATVGGRPAAEAWSILIRGYIANGVWK